MSIAFRLRPIVTNAVFRAHLKKFWPFHLRLFNHSKEFRDHPSLKNNIVKIHELMFLVVRRFDTRLGVRKISEFTGYSQADVIQAIVEFAVCYERYADSRISFDDFWRENKDGLL